KEPGKARSRCLRAYAPSWAAPPGVDLWSVLGCASGPHDPFPGVVVDLERALNRPLVLRHVSEVDADPGPRRAPAAHRVHHDVGRSRCGTTCGCFAFHRSSPSLASFSVAAR